jgi:hypothetical protein
MKTKRRFSTASGLCLATCSSKVTGRGGDGNDNCDDGCSGLAVVMMVVTVDITMGTDEQTDGQTNEEFWLSS